MAADLLRPAFQDLQVLSLPRRPPSRYAVQNASLSFLAHRIVVVYILVFIYAEFGFEVAKNICRIFEA